MNEALTHIDLFSGIGGFALAAQWAGFKTVAFVEIEPYAQEIIKQRFGAVADADSERRQQERRGSLGNETAHGRAGWNGSEPNSDNVVASHGEGGRPRLFGNVFQFDGTRYRGATLLTGGFPCQPFSQAGKRRGKEDDRYLWPEMLRVIHEARPAWVLGENVAGIVTMELDRVLSDLEGEGYAVQSLVIPACAVDAKHRRDRVWIVAHTGRFDSERGSGERGGQEKSRPCDRTARPSEHTGHVADANESRFERSQRRVSENGNAPRRTDSSYCRWQDEGEWFAQSGMGRVASRVSNRVDRLKGLGNAIVPQVAYEIIKGIAEIEQG